MKNIYIVVKVSLIALYLKIKKNIITKWKKIWVGTHYSLK